MYGKATLEIPPTGTIGPSHTEGLSDQLAMIMGRTAAWTLPDEGPPIKVTLEDGSGVNIGLDENGRMEIWDDERI